MPQNKTAKIDMPPCAAFLAEPHRYKVMWGGRNGVKSWSMARQLIINGTQQPIRWLCCREIMRTIRESVHTLLADQIKMMGLDAHYDIQSNAIYGVNGTRFVYAGLRSLINDATALKAYESFDGAWIEEAQTISKASLRTLIPTIRKAGSEIWFSLNPVLETDPIIDFIFTNPPENLIKVKTSYRDNLWLSEEAIRDMGHLKETNPDEYDHVYEGNFLAQVEGAVYGKELTKLKQDGRITEIPYDQAFPVQTFWDIGDRWTSIWFVQAFPFQYRIIDYLAGEGLSISDYMSAMQGHNGIDGRSRRYVYSTHHLPWDATAKELGSGRSIEEQMDSAGFDVYIVQRLSVGDGINAARTIFPQCWFDAENCEDGLHGLRHYQWAPEGTKGQEKREPLHNWASHPADAFRYFAVGIQTPLPKDERPRTPVESYGAWT